MLVSYRSMCVAVVRVLQGRFAGSNSGFVSVVSSRFFVGVLRSVGICKGDSRYLRFFQFRVVRVYGGAVSIGCSYRVVVVARVLLLFLRFVGDSYLQCVQGRHAGRSGVASTPIGSGYYGGYCYVLVRLWARAMVNLY